MNLSVEELPGAFGSRTAPLLPPEVNACLCTCVAQASCPIDPVWSRLPSDATRPTADQPSFVSNPLAAEMRPRLTAADDPANAVESPSEIERPKQRLAGEEAERRFDATKHVYPLHMALKLDAHAEPHDVWHRSGAEVVRCVLGSLGQHLVAVPWSLPHGADDVVPVAIRNPLMKKVRHAGKDQRGSLGSLGLLELPGSHHDIEPSRESDGSSFGLCYASGIAVLASFGSGCTARHWVPGFLSPGNLCVVHG